MSETKTAIGIWLTCCLLCLGLAGNAVGGEQAPGVSNAGVLFLLISGSSRANGMGGCMLNSIDEESPLYNPGALGLFHMDRLFSVSFPHTVAWLPVLSTDMKYKTFNIGGGVSTRLFFPENSYDLSIGFGYGKQEIDYGKVDSFNPGEKADYYSVGLGFDYYARLGIGISKKQIESDLGPSSMGFAEANAIDFGLLVELPLADIINKSLQSEQAHNSDYGLTLTPSFAYVYNNSGDSIKYVSAAQADPLPEQKKIGVGLHGAFTYRDADAVSFRMAWERHRSQIGKPYKAYRQGAEFGVFDAAFLRFGAHSDAEANTSYDTFGFGFSLRGILRLLLINQPDAENDILRYLVTHVDFTIDYARYSGFDSSIDETAFTSLCLSF